MIAGTAPAPQRNTLPGTGGVDLRALAEQRSRENGTSVEDDLWAIVERLIAQAKGGCLRSAQMVFERLCLGLERDGKGPIISIDARQVGDQLAPGQQPVPTGPQLHKYMVEMAELIVGEKDESGPAVQSADTTDEPDPDTATGCDESAPA